MSGRLTPRPVREALDFGERPDPLSGIFETVRFTDGTAPLLETQLERLADSAEQLYGLRLPELGEAARASLPSGSGRLRVSFAPDRPAIIEHGPRGPDPVYTQIAPFVLAGGLGRHKWNDRRLLEAISAVAGPRALPLLLDADGSVLESTHMNVLIEEHGRLISSPSDGRFRPGFGRSGLPYDEEPVDLDRLLASDAVVLTSALRVLRLPQ